MLPLLLVIVPLLRTRPPRTTKLVSPRLTVPPRVTCPFDGLYRPIVATPPPPMTRSLPELLSTPPGLTATVPLLLQSVTLAVPLTLKLPLLALTPPFQVRARPAALVK